jgi:hypothetical protein
LPGIDEKNRPTVQEANPGARTTPEVAGVSSLHWWSFSPTHGPVAISAASLGKPAAIRQRIELDIGEPRKLAGARF